VARESSPGRARNLPPVRKSLGQHFLEDRRILDRIVDALEPASNETVIEIGPGRGSLSDALVDRVGRLILIEYDRALAAHLRKRYAGVDRVTVVESDVLETNLAELAGGSFKLIGNVPYYITTPILFHALEAPRASRIVLLVQREVGDRIVSAPGTKAYGALRECAGRRGRKNRVSCGARFVQPAAESGERGRRDRAAGDAGRRTGVRELVSAIRAGCIRDASQTAATRHSLDRRARCRPGGRRARRSVDRPDAAS
jgi:Ribosomal RNA adenine dimethylase